MWPVRDASQTMKPPPSQPLDHADAGTDLPLRHPPPLRRCSGASILLVATGARRWSRPRSPGSSRSRSVARSTYWRSLVILNTSYWYVWALFTPAIVWLSQHFRFERRGLWPRLPRPHPVGRDLFSLAHIAGDDRRAAGGWRRWPGRPFAWWTEVQRSALLNFDWEMITYWAIVGLSHAVLYYRESRDRALRAAQLETRLVEAQLAALQQQLHPHFLFNTLHAISR